LDSQSKDKNYFMDMPPVTIICPLKGWASIDLRELWNYRELLYSFVARDVKVRYKPTALGAAWAVIQPLGKMVLRIAESKSKITYRSLPEDDPLRRRPDISIARELCAGHQRYRLMRD
jgi:hypothetical protein